MTLVEVMIAAAIAGAVLFAVAEMLAMNARNQTRTNLTQSAQNFRQRILEVLNSTPSWYATVADSANTTFECLKPPGKDCASFAAPESTPGAERGFRIVNSGGEEVYNPLKASTGLTAGGSFCQEFPSSRCPLRMSLTWKAFCPAGVSPCIPAEVEVQGRMTYNPGPGGTAIAFNPENYSFILNKEVPVLSAPTPHPSASAGPPPASLLVLLRGPMTPGHVKQFCSMMNGYSPQQRQMKADEFKLELHKQGAGGLTPMIDQLLTICSLQTQAATE